MATVRFSAVVRRFSSSGIQHNLVKPPIQLFGIYGRYANALYSAAFKEKKLEAVEKDFTNLRKLFSDNPKLVLFIEDPTLKKEKKAGVMQDILKAMKVDGLTVNAFSAMADNGRLKNCAAIMNAFALLMSAHRGEIMATVTTAKQLDAKETAEVQAALNGFLKKGETLKLNTKVDTGIIGGMIVEVGDRYADMSMRSKIKAYTGLIKEAV